MSSESESVNNDDTWVSQRFPSENNGDTWASQPVFTFPPAQPGYFVEHDEDVRRGGQPFPPWLPPQWVREDCPPDVNAAPSEPQHTVDIDVISAPAAPVLVETPDVRASGGRWGGPTYAQLAVPSHRRLSSRRPASSESITTIPYESDDTLVNNHTNDCLVSNLISALSVPSSTPLPSGPATTVPREPVPPGIPHDAPGMSATGLSAQYVEPKTKTVSGVSSSRFVRKRNRVESVVRFHEALPRNYNTGAELENVVTALGIKKKDYPWDKILFLGFLAGTWTAFAGLFTVAIAGGVPVDVRAAWPVLPKILTGCTFPVGMIFIVLFGGELFSGNTMIIVVALLNRKVTFPQLLQNWLLVFTSNLLTVLLWTYLLGYQTQIFNDEPHRTFILDVANTKAALPFHVALLRSIPANALICLALFLGMASRDVTGKIVGLYLPVATFAASGWEHCVANMFFLSLGRFYGASAITFTTFASNIFTVALGNIIGGSILIGGSEHYMYHWHREKEPTKHRDVGRFCCWSPRKARMPSSEAVSVSVQPVKNYKKQQKQQHAQQRHAQKQRRHEEKGMHHRSRSAAAVLVGATVVPIGTSVAVADFSRPQSTSSQNQHWPMRQQGFQQRIRSQLRAMFGQWMHGRGGVDGRE
ncbi:hypothetical protein HK102_003972 [Quaeritorhiza haematococci]|nr:hypothetical protein HK102_003972 [Quaeritorhiza haematococci]